MKNKHSHSYLALHSRPRLLKRGLITAILILSSFLLLTGPKLSALPGAHYRYYASQCSSSDAECLKYSAQAGVYRAYRGILNRNPDAGGLSYWSDRLQNGSTSFTSLMSQFLNLPEWQNAYPGMSNSQFVTQTYQFVLRRAPDSGGYNYWLGKLNSGTSRGQMVASMANSSESANVYHALFMSYYSPPPPPAPAPSPSPAPAPAPKPSSSTPAKTSQKQAANSPAPTATAPTASGQQIIDLIVSEVNYKKAVVSWKTSKPSSSKVNFSTNQNDLYYEEFIAGPTTEHRVELSTEDLKAGNQYFFRVTAEDGSKPLTLDSEFSTTPIAVIVKVTDEANQPLAEATVSVDDISQVTDENGEATLELPEGEVTIFAEKDDLSQVISAKIEVPGADQDVQRVTLSLSKSGDIQNEPTSSSKKSSLWPVLITVILVLGLAGGAFIIFMKRRGRTTSPRYHDPLEAENYGQHVLPSTHNPEPAPALTPLPASPPSDTPTLPAQPEPTFQPLEATTLPHHTSIPELVGRYGTQPDDSLPPEAVSLTGQTVPHHTSLKELVTVPDTQPAPDTEPAVNDLPASPLSGKEDVHASTKHHQSPSHHKASEESTLTIEH